MGKAMSLMVRASQRFNAETRAHRVLEKQTQSINPKAAPKYEANIRELERNLEEIPDLVEKMNRKDANHDDRLKKVFVSSKTEIIENTNREAIDTDKPLPLDRKTPENFEYGYKESDKVPRGKVSMRNVLEFLSDNHTNPQEFTASKIAADYHLKEEYVKDILENYKMLSLHIGDPKNFKQLKRDFDMPMIEGKRIAKKSEA